MAKESSSFSLRPILEKDKLTRTNFLDWFRNLRIVLTQERRLYVLDRPIPNEPAKGAPGAEWRAWEKHFDDSLEVSCLMVDTMIPELHEGLDQLMAYEMITRLKEMFSYQIRQDRFETTKALMSCVMAEGESVHHHVMKMRRYVDHLDRLGFPLTQEFATGIILCSLPKSYDPFIKSLLRRDKEKTVSELHGMLKSVEATMIQKREGKKKGKDKGKGIMLDGETKPEDDPQSPAKKAKPSEEVFCSFCQVSGHAMRKCKYYWEDQKKQKCVKASTSGIYVIKSSVFLLKSLEYWIHM